MPSADPHHPVRHRPGPHPPDLHGPDPHPLDPHAPDPRPLDLRLVPAASTAWAAGGAAVALPTTALVVAAVLTGALAGALLVLARRRGRVPGPAAAPGTTGRTTGRTAGRTTDGVTSAVAAVGAATAAVTAVVVAVLAAGVLQGAGPLVDAAAAGRTVELEVLVTGEPRVTRATATAPPDQRTWVVRATASSLSSGDRGDVGSGAGTGTETGIGIGDGAGAAVPLRAPVLVLGSAAWGQVHRGDHLLVPGALLAAEPGDDVRALVLARGDPEVLQERGRGARLVEHLRAGLRAACAPLGSDAGGLLPGLVLGDTSQLPPDLDAAMRTTGLTHLTAVSGSNVAMVTGTVLALAGLLGAGRRARAVVAALALLGYAALAGLEPSVLRASAMGCIALLGLLGARRGAGLPALAAAVVVLVVVDPWLARSPGFALSVLATGALLLLAAPWARSWSRVMPPWLATALAVPVAAQLVCGPVVLLLSDGVPLTAVPANLLVAPVVGPATVLGLAAALVAPWWPGGAGLLAWGGGWGTAWIARVARTAADLPAGTLPWPSGWTGALLLAALTVAVLWFLRVLAALVRRPADGWARRVDHAGPWREDPSER